MGGSPRFTDELRRLAEPIWRAQHEHPFVREIGCGTVNLDQFRHWVKQDYLFLIEYCRLFGLAAALLPCMWGYSEIGQELKARGLPEEPRCRAWIEMYADPAFAALSDWCRALVDRLAEAAAPDQRQRLIDAFLTSSRYELRFWDMAAKLETWAS